MKRYTGLPKMNVTHMLFTKKSYFLNLVFVCISLMLMSCEKEVNNIKIPQAPPKLAIAAFISPQDTILRVSVVKSIPVLGRGSLSSENIRDAVVVLSDGTNSVMLPYNEQERIYTTEASNLPVLPGKTYYLTVTNSEGLQAEASCTVPLSENNTLEMIGGIEEDEYGNSYKVQLRWRDTPGEVNFYRAFAEVEVAYKYNWPDTGRDTILTRYDDIFWDGTHFYSDSRLDGSAFSSSKGTLFNATYVDRDPNVYSATIYGYLLNTDEPYYRYHQSIRNNSNDNPFAEPTPIYSNVNGGLGVFASYNRSTVTIKLK